MALKTSSGAIPEGSVVLSENEAILYQWKQVTSWKPLSDVWPLKFGMPLSGMACSVTAMYINNHYRNALKLGAHGRIVSFLPTVIIPAIAASVYHQQKVLSEILVLRSECPVCLQIRSAAVQAFFGSLYPTLLAPFAGFMLATRHYTYDVPAITESPKETLKLWFKLFKRMNGILVAAACGHALFGAGLAFLQVKSMIKMNEKLLAAEKENALLDS
ncbi:uncharacterized protein LOC124163882 [Ischnura elegans]|uniref:uncharacterized protein LOC124163882 n=1 Tax=Ischnura elegans TaxID=197161 RepID=UPI001ED89ADF|nr:uncharacterized protein LOC124163882 [Ischnura elegans]